MPPLTPDSDSKKDDHVLVTKGPLSLGPETATIGNLSSSPDHPIPSRTQEAFSPSNGPKNKAANLIYSAVPPFISVNNNNNYKISSYDHHPNLNNRESKVNYKIQIPKASIQLEQNEEQKKKTIPEVVEDELESTTHDFHQKERLIKTGAEKGIKCLTFIRDGDFDIVWPNVSLFAVAHALHLYSLYYLLTTSDPTARFTWIFSEYL